VLAEVSASIRSPYGDCVARNHVAKVHAYPDHVFVVLHAPERGKSGHVRDRLHSSRARPRPRGAADSHGLAGRRHSAAQRASTSDALWSA